MKLHITPHSYAIHEDPTDPERGMLVSRTVINGEALIEVLSTYGTEFNLSPTELRAIIQAAEYLGLYPPKDLD